MCVAFHNGSNYDYHFIIRKLLKKFKNQFSSLHENTEKYITLTAPIEKEVTRIDKSIFYILQLIDSARCLCKIIIKSY